VYGRSDRDLQTTLAAMERDARIRSDFNSTEARRLLAETIRLDRRFDGYNADEVARRVQECRQSGAVLDLNDYYDVGKGQSRPV
jgi:hypothetical protein